MNGTAPTLLAWAASILGLAAAVLTVRLRQERAAKRRVQREAEEANRTLAAFVSQATEDFFQDGGKS
jgi:type II secretory pathway component PulJ